MDIVFENIRAFIVWFGSSGGIIAMLSFGAERWSWFQGLTPKQKQGLSWAAAFILPQVSLALLDLIGYIPPEAWAKMEIHFQALVSSAGVIATLFFSELAHKADKRFRK